MFCRALASNRPNCLQSSLKGDEVIAASLLLGMTHHPAGTGVYLDDFGMICNATFLLKSRSL